MAISKKQIGIIVGGVAVVALVGVGIGVLVNNLGSGDQAGSAEENVAAALSFDLTSQNAKDRPRLDAVDEAIASFDESGFQPIEAGKLTVAVTVGSAPLGITASDDNTTPLGLAADIGQLLADGLELEYNPVIVSWADWQLGVQSGKYDVVTANVTVTEERKDLFDFASWRKDLLGFYVNIDNTEITEFGAAENISGLKIVVGSGTNQEEILLNWNKELEAAGKEPAELVYYDDTAAASLALASGRVDATFGPNVTAAYNAAATGETKLIGLLDGGYPETAPIAVGTAKDNGLVESVSIVLNAAIEGGEYQEVLDRWGAEDEAIEKSEINPPGLPRS